MLSAIRKHDFTILLTLYFFLLPMGKTLWYPLLAMAIIGGVLFYQEIRVSRPIETGTRWLLIGGSFVFIPALTSLITSVDLARTSTFLISYPLFYLSGYFLYKRLSQGVSITPAVTGITLIVFAWGILSIWQYLDPNNPFGPGGSHNQGIHTRDNQFVDGGLMLGVILGSLLGFLCFAIWQNGYRAGSIMLGVFIIGLIFISGTRSAWLSAIVTIFAIPVIALIKGLKPSKKAFFGLVVICLSVIASGYALVQLPGLNVKLNQTFVFLNNPTRAGFDEALSGRLDIWEDAISLGMEQPITGFGVNNYRYAVPELDVIKGARWLSQEQQDDGTMRARGASHTHQIFMEAFSGAGTLGVLGLVGLFIFLGRTSIKVAKAGSIIAAGALVALWAGFFPLNTHNNLYGGWMSAWFWVWMGISAGLIFPNRADQADQ